MLRLSLRKSIGTFIHVELVLLPFDVVYSHNGIQKNDHYLCISRAFFVVTFRIRTFAGSVSRPWQASWHIPIFLHSRHLLFPFLLSMDGRRHVSQLDFCFVACGGTPVCSRAQFPFLLSLVMLVITAPACLIPK